LLRGAAWGSRGSATSTIVTGDLAGLTAIEELLKETPYGGLAAQ
jgi:hypothetical protein